MDFQSLVDSFDTMACVIAIEKGTDSAPDRFCIVTGNRSYLDTIENPAPGMELLTDKFVPYTDYTDYLVRDLSFEQYCYSAAVDKKCHHSYVHPEIMDAWFNMTFLPLGNDDDRVFYCLYLMEISTEQSTERMSNISADIASSVLDTCIRIRGTNDFRATITDVIHDIRDLCDAEHCCILVMNELDRSCYVLCEALSDDTPLLPMDNYVDKAFYDIAESWQSTIAGSNCLIAKNEQDMLLVKERNPIWYSSITSAGGHSIILFPLKSRNQLIGYMWAINFDATRSIRIKETLEVTTFILGSELGNYLLLDRLKVLSSKDILTGVMNRNEMNNYVDTLSRGEKHDGSSVAVLFIDMNGLKWVNDSRGHVAGDILLKNAAAVLREVFDERDIFRAGGDEFAVITLDITEEDMEARIEKIREICDSYENLSMAIGGCIEPQCRNVRMALRIADERMYDDKRRFYEANPGGPVSAKLSRGDMSRRVAEAYVRDPITGLYGMEEFFAVSEQYRKNSHMDGVDTCLAFFNLCGLKYFNKKYGFSEGEVLIKELAGILESIFGVTRCARMGQDNFAVVAEGEGIEDKLKAVFRDLKRANGGRTLFVRAGIYLDSMGIVESSLAYDRAKYACNIIREDNCSYYRIFDKEMLETENMKLYVIENIDRAISENWITAFYQPIVRAANRKVCDEEALVRWIDPEKGMLSPAEFIPILEESRLIYKVDLRMVDIVLEKLKHQRNAGLHLVPNSVNLSRADFEVCDIVQEITNRVDASGIARKYITIEITESIIGENFEFMKEQIERFRRLGFSVWMDDFGSGYSSLDLLQDIHFDLIKFDMRFMRQFDQKPESRIILNELMRMAISLDTETVVEGVETEEQMIFLSEIGCTKLQGYYFCQPIPLASILERYRTGTQIGFEDPAEIEYNRAVSSINLHDLSAVSSREMMDGRQFFNSQPMTVIEYDGEYISVIRCNRAYQEFAEHQQGLIKLRQTVAVADLKSKLAIALYDALTVCEEDGQRAFVDETINNGEMIHALIRKVMTNSLNGRSAYVVAIMGITQGEEEALSFSDMARALSADYIYLYHVNILTEAFTEYSFGGGADGMTAERRGKRFFEESRKDARTLLHADDQDRFIAAFTKTNVRNALRKNGAFVLSYRLLIDGEPKPVVMKAVKLGKDDNQLIIGIRLDTSV